MTPRPRPLPPRFRLRPFTTAEARSAGITRRRTRAADLRSPFHGIRDDASAPDDLRGRCEAYALRMPAPVVFTHVTAAVLQASRCRGGWSRTPESTSPR